jgi:hypothetical protein
MTGLYMSGPRDKWAMKSAMFTRDLPTSEISESYNGIQVLFEEQRMFRGYTVLCAEKNSVSIDLLNIRRNMYGDAASGY